ncbi:26S proteasome regulatory subunit rpn1, putative [Ixodes scapularis]|uniref:26S proteasome non-ATPase regulatory subunit 2 n=1 Tax=Ixodes scapularis TaxID=6945 RepID=B7Q3Z3_IXOSC|nr:26S proteasome regulatory subunit rpn1, putative [Ixodes scapularis]|eukprot:XP_002411422.1 26S proteasome regulatory subunit rpn1, putative [Ixodes scapularis]
MKEKATTPAAEAEQKPAKEKKNEGEKELEMEDNSELYLAALESLRTQIKASTTSMTSVPKPLKFLKPHYKTLQEVYEKITETETKSFCADIVSILAMTISEERECLKYRLLGSREDIGSWGHEYVRHLAGEISQEWSEVGEGPEQEAKREALLRLAQQIVPYHMAHNAEAEACDLLMEIERLDLLQAYVDQEAYPRVCLYLTSCVPYVPEPENTNLLKTAMEIFLKYERYPESSAAGHAAQQPRGGPEDLHTVQGPKQMAFMLGRQQMFLEPSDEIENYDDLAEIVSNTSINDHFMALARELDIMEPKTPEDIYKSHLDNTRMFSATASLGLILLWNVDGGLTQIDKYLYSTEDYIKAGAILACGIVNCGVRNECDPALALLSDYVLHSSTLMRIGSILGLGLAYAGSNNKEVIVLLLPVFTDPKSTMEVLAVTSIACGMVAVGSCNGDVTSTIMTALLEKSETDLKDTYARFLPLGLGLCYLGKQEGAETITAALEVLPEPFRSMATTLVDICAYAGTGNVLKIQHLLHICSEHYEVQEKEEKKDDKKDKKEDKEEKSTGPPDLSSQQSVAVLGIALIAMGEEIGSEMAFRAFGHLLRYGEPVIKKAVPLALALISVSNPRLNILETLSKFSHDSDNEVAHNAIFGLGIVGAGTNNARLAAMLRQLAQYHAKDPNHLFMVRLAQGLAHMGKGTLTLGPYHSDRQLMSPVATAGLLATLLAFLDVKSIILGKSHYLLYCLVTAIQPRMLVTFDEKLQPLPVPVRVGQAVDVVGQAGKPKTITGFQTHTTPVLLAYGERAELATEEYISLTPVLEGFVILKKNENFTT